MSTITKIPSLEIGGRLQPLPDETTGFKILSGAATAGNSTSLKYRGTSYIVPASKQFRIIGVRIIGYSTSTSAVILYNDANITNGSPTNPIYFPNYAASPQIGQIGVLAYNQAPVVLEVDWVVPTGKYPTMRDGTGNDVTVIVMGFEEAN